MPTISVTRTYLELKTPGQLREAVAPPEGARVVPVPHCPPPQFRWLYETVGGPWHWRDRLGWTMRPSRATSRRIPCSSASWSLRGNLRATSSYNRLPDGAIEVIHIGLVPEYIGRGLGGYLVRGGARRLGARGHAGLPQHLHAGRTVGAAQLPAPRLHDLRNRGVPLELPPG